MPKTTEAQKRAHQKYMQKFAIARVRVEIKKYEEIKAYCKLRGESVSGFVNRAIDETMKRDQETK